MPTALFAVQEAARTHAQDTGLLTLRNHRSQGGQLAFFYFREGKIYAIQVDGYEFSLAKRLLSTGHVSSKVDMDNAIAAAGSAQSLSLPYVLAQRQLTSFEDLKSLIKDDFLAAAQVALSWENVKPSWSSRVSIEYPLPSISIDKLTEVLEKRQEKLAEVSNELNTTADELLTLTAQAKSEESRGTPEEEVILRLSQSGYPSLEDLAEHAGLTTFGIIRHSYELWDKGLLDLYNKGRNIRGDGQGFTFEREEGIESILAQSDSFSGDEDNEDPELPDSIPAQDEPELADSEEVVEDSEEETAEELNHDNSNGAFTLETNPLNTETSDEEDNEPEDEVDLSFIGAFTLDLENDLANKEESDESGSDNLQTPSEAPTDDTEESETVELTEDEDTSKDNLESLEENDSEEDNSEEDTSEEISDELESLPVEETDELSAQTPQHFGSDEVVELEDEAAAPQLAVAEDATELPESTDEVPSASTPTEERLVSETVARVESDDPDDDVDLDYILEGMKKIAVSREKSSDVISELEENKSVLESQKAEIQHKLESEQTELVKLKEQVRALEESQEALAEDLKKTQEDLSDNETLLDKEKSKSARFQEGLAQLQTLLGR